MSQYTDREMQKRDSGQVKCHNFFNIAKKGVS